MDTYIHALETFNFIVIVGQTLSKRQYLIRIKETVPLDNPRNKALYKALEQSNFKTIKRTPISTIISR